MGSGSGPNAFRRRVLRAAGFAELLAALGAAQEYRTPRAGEAFETSVLGVFVQVPSRDRNAVTAGVIQLYGVPDGPQERRFSPSGELYLWRNPAASRTRLRAELLGVYDDVRWNRSLGPGSSLESVLTFENLTLPFDRSEYVEGVRIASEELRWHTLRAGLGIGYRRSISPSQGDNAFEADLTLEPGWLLFQRGDETGRDYLLPEDTFEARAHLRVRADALERNVLELPHRGFAAGLDGRLADRARWADWGGPILGVQRGTRGRRWSSLSAYAIAAFGIPSCGERHRLLASLYGGIGSHLDRFSAFRLGGGSNAGDSETITRPVLPGAAVDEFFPSRYAIVNAEYRYEAAAILYLQLRGTLAWLDRPRFRQDGSIAERTQPLPALTGGVTSGFFWDSSIELAYSYNFGVIRRDDGQRRRGGSSLLLSFAKEF
jgi:hypothetical protein